MSRIHSALLTGLWVGLTVGISDVILDAFGVQSRLIKAIVFAIAIYIILTIIEKYKRYKVNSINVTE